MYNRNTDQLENFDKKKRTTQHIPRMCTSAIRALTWDVADPYYVSYSEET